MLHVTSGDITARSLRASGLPGEVLPWRDVLCEGPLRGDLDTAGFAAVRARYIADCGWGAESAVLADLRAADARLDAALAAREPVVLWFEHDLHDQVQLAQLLARLAAVGRPGPWSLVCVNAFPGVTPFIGLGQLRPEALASLYPARRPVTEEDLAIGSQVWRGLCDATPQKVQRWIEAGGRDPAYLGSALRRWLEEFPSIRGGLSVTEERVLEELDSGDCGPETLFARCQAREPAPFRGDWSFWRVVARLASGHMPLVEVAGGGRFVYPPRMGEGNGFAEQRLRLTRAGARVCAGRVDAVQLNGIDHWIGGVHLRPGSLWRRHGDGSVAIENRS